MPTKSSYQSRPPVRCSTGSTACAAIASATSSVMTKPCAPWNSLSRRNSAASARRRSQVGRRACGQEADSAPAWPARPRRESAGRARSLRSQLEHQALSAGRRAARRRADRHSTCARGGCAATSQSLSTMRCRPSPRSWSAGRCVWPWTSVCGIGLLQPVARGVGVDVGPDHVGAALAVFALRAHRARERAAFFQRRASNGLLPFGRAHLRAEAQGIRCLRGTARRRGSAASARRAATSTVGSSSSVMPHCAAKPAPTRKSRLPCMKKTGTRCADASRSSSAHSASKPGWAAASSPTQTSNRSPRMKSASAGVVSQVAAPGLEGGRLVGLQVQVGDEVDGAPRGRRHAARRMPVTASCARHRRRPSLDRDDGLLDHHVFERHVVVEALAAGLHGLDLVDHVGAADDLAEHRVAPALGRGRGVVQEAVVRRR